MLALLDSKSEAIAKVATLDCDLLEISRELGRENAFSTTVFRMLTDLPLKPNQSALINNEKLI